MSENTEKYLLSDEQIRKVLDDISPDATVGYGFQTVCRAQLAHAEPLIRAEVIRQVRGMIKQVPIEGESSLCRYEINMLAFSKLLKELEGTDG